MHDDRPLILTAKLDYASQASFYELRQRYFPSGRNMIPAHLSLFNRLPGDVLGPIISDLEESSSGRNDIPAVVSGLRFLGKGVAYTLDAPGLAALRAELAERWEQLLGPQDLQGISPHVTIQNKVDPATAKSLYRHLSSTFTPTRVTVEGVSLWRYLGGPWVHLRDFRFLENA